MPSEILSGIDGLVSQILLGFLFVVAFIGLRAFLFWRRIIRRRQEIERHKDAGTIGPTGMLQGATLPWHYDKLAQLGTGGQAPMTLDQRVLKPSIGVRLIVLGLCAAMVYFVNQMSAGEMNGFQVAEPGAYGTVMIVICLLAAVNGVFYIFTFETRYDRDMLVVTRMMFHRREYRWKNLWRIADDGAYELQLFFEPGGKAKVLKHSVGIEEFKDFALAQIRRNRMANA
ncbi:hypothetical protein [Rhodobacter sp. SY28-1]|uniref:hypothetical protein n=1 Tax=Rhodobacter sp. SY28-1 TaxID=2562317 RepID=UPI0010C00AE8|nr:hypothetical protein [Rhodobacter sp. SY28-1]